MNANEYCVFALDEDRDAWVCSKCGFTLRNAKLLGAKAPYAFCKAGVPHEPPDEAARRIGNKSGGPGDELKRALEWLGIHATEKCSCNAKAALMNAKGADWCEENIEEIVGWLREEAKKRRLPFIDEVGRRLVRWAIANARKKAAT